MTTTDPTAAPQPATPGEAIDLDAVAEDLYEASEHIDHPDAAYHPWALKALRTAEKLAAEVRRMRGEWQVLTDRWGHYKRRYLGALEEAERLRGELAETEAARANLQRNAEILADEVVLGNAVVTPEPEAAPAADPGWYRLPDEPPDEVTELWEVRTGRRWDRHDVRGGWSVDGGKSIWPWPEPVVEAGEDGPLSTTPPEDNDAD